MQKGAKVDILKNTVLKNSKPAESPLQLFTWGSDTLTFLFWVAAWRWVDGWAGEATRGREASEAAVAKLQARSEEDPKGGGGRSAEGQVSGA